MTVPSSQPQWNSQPEVQRITLRNNLASQQVALRVLYPPGNDVVLDITVSMSSGDPASLSHPRLGLNITANGVQLPELVPVAGGKKSADRLLMLLQRALGITSDLDAGVEWLTRPGGAVTFRVAAATAKVRHRQGIPTLGSHCRLDVLLAFRSHRCPCVIGMWRLHCVL